MQISVAPMSTPAAFCLRMGHSLAPLAAFIFRFLAPDRIRSPHLDVMSPKAAGPGRETGALLNGIAGASAPKTLASPLLRARDPEPGLHSGPATALLIRRSQLPPRSVAVVPQTSYAASAGAPSCCDRLWWVPELV